MLHSSKQQPDRFPIHRIIEAAAVVIIRRNTKLQLRNESKRFSHICCSPKLNREQTGPNSKTLSRHIILWKQGLQDELFSEAKALQILHPQQKCEVTEGIK